MRDTLKPAEYWAAYLPDHRDFLDEIEEEAQQPDRSFELRLGDAYDLQSDYYQHGSALYASGAPMEEVVTYFREFLLIRYPAFVTLAAQKPIQSKADYAGGWDERYKILSLAVLLGLTPEESAPIVQALDFWEEPDGGMELLIAHLGHGDGRAQTRQLLWPDAYEDLFLAMHADTEPHARDVHLADFMAGWMKEMRSSTNAAYNNHNNPHDIYFGYWCWEAAAVSVAMGFDDTVLRKNKYYPADFADWARRKL